MPTTIYGALRTDTTMTNAQASTTLSGTFQISAYSQITIDDGADGTIYNGDHLSNETPNDVTQTLSGGNAIFWDFTITVTDGTNTYEIGVFDYDINNDGDMIGVDAEDGYFLAFLNGSVPPLNTTLTITAIVENDADIPRNIGVPCFVAGTLITTPEGLRAIETLSVGDLVETLDHGPQEIRWIASRKLNNVDLVLKPKLRPIRIESGALGMCLPLRDLCVSPQHRMLIRSPIAARMFDENEMLIAANKLTEAPGIAQDATTRSVTYVHMLFDRHEIVFAEGAPTESLFTGAQVMKLISSEAREEITTLFPQIGLDSHNPRMARSVPKRGRQARKLVQRHVKNKKSLIVEV